MEMKGAKIDGLTSNNLAYHCTFEGLSNHLQVYLDKTLNLGIIESMAPYDIVLLGNRVQLNNLTSFRTNSDLNAFVCCHYGFLIRSSMVIDMDLQLKAFYHTAWTLEPICLAMLLELLHL